jgi:hypothetical protein
MGLQLLGLDNFGLPLGLDASQGLVNGDRVGG